MSRTAKRGTAGQRPRAAGRAGRRNRC